jgi:hypothetical protein
MKAKKAASSVSEALHLKLSALAVHDDGQSPPYTPYESHAVTPLVSPIVNASSTSLSSETNWSLQFDDFDIKDPIGKKSTLKSILTFSSDTNSFFFWQGMDRRLLSMVPFICQ